MPLGAIAQSLEAISGPTHGKSGDTLTFVVEARDSDGNPQSGVKVLFGISPSDDTSDLGTYSTTTRVGGRAKTTLILENNATGIYRISAWRTDNNFTAIFNVTIDAAPLPRSITATTTTSLPEPPILSIVSGDGQEGVAGAVLADPFVVEIRDENGKSLRRITVTFTITAGRGAMSVVTSTTDSDGRVASVMTLSSEPGLNRVQVSAEGLSQTVIFNAEGTVPPPEPMVDETEEMLSSMPESMTNQDTTPPISTPEPPTSLEFDLSLPTGLNLIHVPLKVRAIDGMAQTIESVADLYDVLGGAAVVNFLITYDPATQAWRGYFGSADSGTPTDRILTDPAGILASIKTPVSVRLGGDALGVDSMSAITLTPGLNLLGLPLRDARLTRVSDLFALEGIGGNVAVITLTDNGEFKAVGRPGDPGDIEITGGQAFILIAAEGAMVPIVGDAWTNTAADQ